MESETEISDEIHGTPNAGWRRLTIRVRDTEDESNRNLAQESHAFVDKFRKELDDLREQFELRERAIIMSLEDMDGNTFTIFRYGTQRAEQLYDRLAPSDLISTVMKHVQSNANHRLSKLTLRVEIYGRQRHHKGIRAMGRGKKRSAKWDMPSHCLAQSMMHGFLSVTDKLRHMQPVKFKEHVIRLHNARIQSSDGSATELDIPKILNKDFIASSQLTIGFTEWRVSLYIRRGQRITFKKQYTGPDYEADNGVNGIRGKGHNTIYLLLDEEKEHFEHITVDDVTNFDQRSDLVHCRDCFEYFKYASPAQKRKWREHECNGRAFSKCCGMKFSEDALRWHKDQTKDEHKACPECKEMCYSDGCAMNHVKNHLCLINNFCLKCYSAHKHGEPCTPIKCQGCGKRVSEDQLDNHMCYICRTKKKFAKHRAMLKDRSEEMEDDESATTQESDETEAEQPEGESIEADWSNIYSCDFECEKQATNLKQWRTHDVGTMIDRTVYRQIPCTSGFESFDHKVRMTWEVQNMPERDYASQDEENDAIKQYIIGSMVDALVARIPKQEGKKRKRVTKKNTIYAYFFNLSGYDGRILVSYLKDFAPEGFMKDTSFLMDGNRIKRIDCNGLTFLDSRCHLGGALADLPATYGLKETPSKGIFPYDFCTSANRNYVGPIPDIEYFGIHKLRGQAKIDRFTWWNDERRACGENGWSMKEKLMEYFLPDLRIQADGFRMYAETCVKAGFLSPIGVTTLPGLAWKTFKELYMEENSIAILKAFPSLEDGIGKNYIEKFIRLAYYGGRTEARALKDETTSKRVLEGFDIVSSYVSVMKNMDLPYGYPEFKVYSMDDQPDIKEFKKMHGFAMVEIEPDMSLQQEHPEWFYTPSLPTRENGKLVFALRPCKTPEEIQHWYDHVDGHFEFKAPPNQMETSWKMNTDKFMENGIKHYDRNCERCNKGRPYLPPVYAMPEIIYALEHGYVLRHVYYMATYVGVDKIFSRYAVRTYTLKCMHSDPPKGYDWDDEMECQRYRDEMREKNGIIIPDTINPRDWHQSNKALKAIGKLFGNSVYGYTGMSSMRAETAMLPMDPDIEEEFVATHQNIRRIDIGSETPLYRFTNTSKIGSTIANTNVGLAAYITCGARLNLLRGMHALKDTGLPDSPAQLDYTDTDSIVASIVIGGTNKPKEGTYLGEFSDDFGIPLTQFRATAAKSYAIKGIRKGIEELIKQKFKGITLKGGNNEIIDWEWMDMAVRSLLKKKSKRVPGTVEDFRMWWDNRSGDMMLVNGQKTVHADRAQLKGKLAKDGRIFPFGSERFEIWKDIHWV